MTKIELELVPDPDTYIYIFFEKGTRGGGISYIFKNRYIKYQRIFLIMDISKQSQR